MDELFVEDKKRHTEWKIKVPLPAAADISVQRCVVVHRDTCTRFINEDKQPLFLLKSDVAAVLGHANWTELIKRNRQYNSRGARIYKTLLMLLPFENHYVVAVVIFMVTLLFCKNMIECMQACIQVSQALMCKDLFFCPCVHKGHAELLCESILKVLLLFSVFQPLVLLLVKRTSESMLEHQSFWTVNVGHVVINTDAFAHSTNDTAAV